MAAPTYENAIKLYQQRDLDGALSMLRKYLRIQPNDAQAQISAGVILQEQNKLKEALEFFLQGVQINPDPTWLVTVGGVLSKFRGEGRIQEEIDHYQQAIKTKPDLPSAWYALAGAYLYLGDYDQAEQAASRAVELDPTDARNYHQLALAFFFRGDDARAMELFDQSNVVGVKTWDHLFDGRAGRKLRHWFTIPANTTELLADEAGQEYGIEQPRMAQPFEGYSYPLPNLHFRQASIYRVDLANVFVEGLYGLVYDDNYVYANQYTRIRGVWRFFCQATPKHPRQTVQLDRIVALQPPDLPNYYHWVTECLPQLLLLKEIMDDDPNALFLAPRESWPKFITEHLDLLGIDRSRCIPSTAGPSLRYFARHLTYVDWQWPISQSPVAEQTAATWYPPRSLLLRLRAQLAEPHPPAEERDRVIYTSRPTGRQRGVENEGELIEMLRTRYGDKLDVFTGEGMTAQEQIDVFRHARLVVAPHGAGLANIVFCAPGTTIVEFPVLPAVLNFFAHLAVACDLDYWWVPEMNVRYEASYHINATALQAVRATLDACERSA